VTLFYASPQSEETDGLKHHQYRVIKRKEFVDTLQVYSSSSSVFPLLTLSSHTEKYDPIQMKLRQGVVERWIVTTRSPEAEGEGEARIQRCR
jgi:predicted SPOUT superfamily RNA methylase MTH1